MNEFVPRHGAKNVEISHEVSFSQSFLLAVYRRQTELTGACQLRDKLKKTAQWGKLEIRKQQLSLT
jgi:hypothetical protein